MIDYLLTVALEEGGEVDATVKDLIQDVINAARIFIERFDGIYFLKEEPVHEFVGLTYRDESSGQKLEEHRFRLTLGDNTLALFLPREIHQDDMYDVRHLIAESQLPEFRED